MIVRWGLAQLPPLLADLGFERPLLVTSSRFADLDLPVCARFVRVRRHAPLDVVAAATEAAASADGLVGLGGGSAIDTAKAEKLAPGMASGHRTDGGQPVHPHQADGQPPYPAQQPGVQPTYPDQPGGGATRR